MKTHLNMGV